MNKARGFTLIEILIALAVFAILATITSSVLYHAFTTRSRVNEQSTQLNELQLLISFIQQDISQVLERPIRGNEMHLFSAFIGQPYYLELTRDGEMNPDSSEKRSTLKRIAYLCQKGMLLRRTWTTLNPINRQVYEDKPLITQLKDCHFAYLNQNVQVLTEWREQAVTQDQEKEPLPKAIQLNMILNKQGEINLLFILQGALYAPS